MTSGVGDNRQPLSRQSKRRATSGAEKSPSRVHPTSDKGKFLRACISYNIPTVRNIQRREEVIRLKKEVKIKTAKVARSEQSNRWRGMREDTVMKRQQRGLSIPNLDSVNPSKP